jgi:3-hydroxyacyl-[acyl-carrier-protein] dehydratase
MRFVLVDRLAGIEMPRSIATQKNVSVTEDVFADHFPGFPVYPGALVVEAFAQAGRLLIAMSHDFTVVARLVGLTRVAFPRMIRPGDQLAIRCERRAADATWRLDARATVAGETVATATLEYALEPAPQATPAGREAERLRALARELQGAPLEEATLRG